MGLRLSLVRDSEVHARILGRSLRTEMLDQPGTEQGDRRYRSAPPDASRVVSVAVIEHRGSNGRTRLPGPHLFSEQVVVHQREALAAQRVLNREQPFEDQTAFVVIGPRISCRTSCAHR